VKYEFTGETKTEDGITLRRIKRSDTGEVGGWIESERNLAQVSGNAWVSGNARVSGNAMVSGNAWVYGNARVSGNAWVSGNARVAGSAMVSGNAMVAGSAMVSLKSEIYQAGPLGSRNATITAFKCKTGFKVATGCFLGTPEEFMLRVSEVHGDTDHARLYRAFIEMAQYIFRSES